MSFLQYVCHQKPERSFRVGKYVFPVCARCTGIYLGLLAGFISNLLLPLWEVNVLHPLIIFTLALIPIGVDGTGQLLGFWKSNNARRFITGLIIGLVAGAALRIIINWI